MVIKARKYIEAMYEDKCQVFYREKKRQANGSVGFEEVEVYKDLACRLSFRNFPPTSPNPNLASNLGQITLLIISPDIKIKPGSKILVNGVAYKASGQPAIYNTHQEIMLDLFEGWA